MVVYTGVTTTEDRYVYKNGRPFDHQASRKLRDHSPTGFNWGYGGSGPAQLALGLLYDVTRNRTLALRYYQQFKWKVVAGWGDSWSISRADILAWLRAEKERSNDNQ